METLKRSSFLSKCITKSIKVSANNEALGFQFAIRKLIQFKEVPFFFWLSKKHRFNANKSEVSTACFRAIIIAFKMELILVL